MSFLSRLHPLFVHLPIGILLLGILFWGLSARRKHAALAAALPLTFLSGALTALFSCITGWLLAADGGYDLVLLDRHRWLGIAVAVVATAGYALIKSGIDRKWQLPAMVILVLLLTLNSHLGGTLTHGEGYLPLPFAGGKAAVARPIADVQAAQVYDDLVQPLLQNRCAGCHGASKKKGGLRLDTPEGLRAGGENGKVLVGGDPTGSELYRRLTLDLLDEHHMPPKGKTQLREAEIALIRWWIGTGGSFEERVGALPQPEAMRPILKSFQTAGALPPRKPELPVDPVAAAKEEDLKPLRDRGVLLMPVGENSNYLQANFINAPEAGDSTLLLLLPLAPQLVWLRLGNTGITDDGLATIGRLTQLTRLGLENTIITDEGLRRLSPLGNLQSLNLVGTSITGAGLSALAGLGELHTVFLYQTAAPISDWPRLEAVLPRVTLDSGSYHLPVLVGDTAMVKSGE